MKILVLAVLASWCAVTQAAEVIRILWPYSQELPWQNLRMTTEIANAQQNRYVFQPEVRVGAGGSVAAQAALNNANNTLVSNSNTQVIRPLSTKDGWYDIDQFRPILIQAMDVPIILISKKHKTYKEFLEASNLNVGISAAAGITDYAARMMVTKPNTQYINFKIGFPEMMTGILGGHLDGGLASLDSAKRFLDSGSVHRLADSPLTFYWAVYAPVKMDEQKVNDIHAILTEASRDDRVRKILEPVNPRYVQWSLPRLQEWYRAEKAKWIDITSKYPLTQQ